LAKFGKKMSRVGQKPIPILEKVTLRVKGELVEVNGPLGSLQLKLRPEIKVSVKNDQAIVTREGQDRLSRSLHGLFRTLIANMVEGVTSGFQKKLQLVGAGYRAALEGETLVLTLGFSHPIKVVPPPGIKFELEKNEIITVSGIDKAVVGQVAAGLRAIQPPEPYKGKGIRYHNEEVKLKPGKAGKMEAGVAGVAGARGEK
jgi:large subunit ribosomal protein L6